ncbi:hypothetical protein RchiOBHm_Chr5g0016121 [Rosa chinensis]|uniref:Uncharacterized protein n=1 Tax=Rosa chinensis TaxID=74649 RepID=A0A2P6Q651_ROSCH|nr:hypothetical protein RchiOBHm_Chr5g0016121 [Rosa chinensis]
MKLPQGLLGEKGRGSCIEEEIRFQEPSSFISTKCQSAKDISFYREDCDLQRKPTVF